MTSAVRISSITSRIDEIKAQIAARTGADVNGAMAIDVSGPPDSTLGFDPFGVAYQQALLAAGVGAGQQNSQMNGATQIDGSAMRTDSLGVAAFVRPVASSGAGSSGGDRTVGQVGGYGAMPVPAALAVYGNGNIPPAALEPIGQGGHRLWAPAADAWKQAVAAAKADGVDLTVTDSYRSYQQQVDLAKQKGLYASGGFAAIPGTSNHGWGLAVDADITNPAALSWLQANGHRFGFVQAVPREPWHWEFRPAQA